MNYDEWRQEVSRIAKAEGLAKAPAGGGIRAQISPGAGTMGQYTHPGYSPSNSRQGSPAPDSQYPGPNPNSKYTTQRPDQPQPWIDDVDMGSNWYSPFEPLFPFGPPYITRPREWDFPTGYNLNYIPRRMEIMAMLRGMARTWGVLATIIATRQDQLLRIPWTIQRRDKPRASSVAVKEMQKFFRSPDGKLKYSQWSRKLTDDLLILDAPSIFMSRDRKGRLLSAEVLDGATIFPLIDDAGRRPDSIIEHDEDGVQYLKRQPAFQQIIKGLPMVDLDESELFYRPMRPRPDMPIFGYPATEQILVEASEAILKTFYQKNFWQEGNIPDLIITVPDTWTPRNIAMFQAHMDAVLSGNLGFKSKMRFVPGGMKPFDIKNSSGESLWSQRDETLIRLACYAFSVSPAPFVRMLNRATAQNAQQMAEEEGLYPLMSFWKDDVMDSIIQDEFGYDDIEFVFLPRPEPDLEKQAKIHDLKIKSGEYSINEAREAEGLEPISGGDAHMIYIGNQVIPLGMAEAGQALAMPPGGPPSGGKPNGKPKPPPQGQPQRGANQSLSVPTGSPASKPSEVRKADAAQLQSAADQATSHLDNMSQPRLSSGNYPKGHIWIQGLNISIENQKGSKRGEKTQAGKEWEVTMPTHYGYVRGFIGADGMQFDCYLGPNPESTQVWIIDQNRVSKKGKVKGFDEHKAMIGYNSLPPALKDYLASHFDGFGHERLSDVVQLTMPEFKLWLKNGDLKRPIGDQFPTRVVLEEGELQKADTISSSTGLNWYSQGTPPRQRRQRGRRKRIKQGPRWLQLGVN